MPQPTPPIARRVPGIRAIRPSAWDQVLFQDGARPRIVAEEAPSSARWNATFAWLDIAFGPGLVCTAAACGVVRCSAIPSGVTLWKWEPPAGSHVLRLACRDDHKSFLGVQDQERKESEK